MDNVLHLLGIARKAGRVEVGEEPVGASARARQARLILVLHMFRSMRTAICHPFREDRLF